MSSTEHPHPHQHRMHMCYVHAVVTPLTASGKWWEYAVNRDSTRQRIGMDLTPTCTYLRIPLSTYPYLPLGTTVEWSVAQSPRDDFVETHQRSLSMCEKSLGPAGRISECQRDHHSAYNVESSNECPPPPPPPLFLPRIKRRADQEVEG